MPAALAPFTRSYERRLDKMGFTAQKLASTVQLPTLDIVAAPPLITREASVKIGVTASDPAGKLNRLNVFVNDVPVHGSNGVPLRSSTGSTWSDTVEVRLTRGANKIQLSVLGGSGVESLKETIVVNRKAEDAPVSLHAVINGVSSYTDAKNNLEYAAKDARDLAAALAALRPRFAAVNVTTILDKDATRAKILATKKQLMASAVDDEVIIFAAGHGLLDAKLDYYLATTDINFSRPAERGLRYEELESLLDGIPARKKLLLMDTCFSGELDAEELGSAPLPSKDARVKTRAVAARGVQKKNGIGVARVSELLKDVFTDLRRGTGAMVISSAGGAEYALESSEWNNGVFTYSLLQAMRDPAADQDKDGKVKVSELRDYVTQQVLTLSQGKQHPTTRRENLESDFSIF